MNAREYVAILGKSNIKWNFTKALISYAPCPWRVWQAQNGLPWINESFMPKWNYRLPLRVLLRGFRRQPYVACLTAEHNFHTNRALCHWAGRLDPWIILYYDELAGDMSSYRW